MTVRAETQTTSLGRYRVVKRLANGGMADVLLARTDGIEGFERYIVIKRIHAALLDEPRYVKMFLDEARLAASLHHHNIVQVNDIGQEAGEYFFAMEYVHGEDARTLLVEASRRHQQIPVEHVITIITAAAAGLHHAHEQRAADRSPLGIVHRDVSPANILVGFDGSVKVADFGIALAAHRAEHTQSGVLKGKVAYMSPEQCNCERVDRRSDVFSLGVCLYELVTVHPCFTDENDFMTMSKIVAGKITKPSQLASAVDLALEQIILKALAVNPAERFQTADDLRMALEDYATAAGLRSSTTALADYMREQFGERELPWQESEASAAAADDEPEISVSTAADDSQSIIVEDELAIPLERGRPIKQTLPLRPVKGVPSSSPPPSSSSSSPLSPSSGSSEPPLSSSVLALPLRAPKPTPGYVQASPLSHAPVAPAPAAAPVAVVAAITEAVRLPAPGRPARHWWIAATIMLLVFIALGVVAMTGGSRKPAVAPAPRRALEPLPAPSFAAPIPAPPPATGAPTTGAATGAATTGAPAIEAPATKKQSSRRGAKAKAATAPKAAGEPKWDPDSLFPK